MKSTFIPLLAATLLTLSIGVTTAKPVALINVSYDPTRELYIDYNKVFGDYWKKKTGDDLTVTQSHGGSGKQARAVIDGQPADVVTFALPPDIEGLVKAKLVNAGWEKALPDNAAPYTSTIVFLVRKGNPKGIKDWPDLIKADVEVVTPNPKTSGGARWNFLGAYGYVLNTTGKSEAKAKDFVKSLYEHVKVLDTGARGSTVTFVERGQGDVLIAWENEALLTTKKVNPGEFEIVYPSQTILPEPPVAVVDANVDKIGTRALATEYLKYLYSPEGQEVVARNYFRPRDAAALKKNAELFPAVKTFTAGEVFGDWSKTQKDYFGDGGVFDQIYKGAATPPPAAK